MSQKFVFTFTYLIACESNIPLNILHYTLQNVTLSSLPTRVPSFKKGYKYASQYKLAKI